MMPAPAVSAPPCLCVSYGLRLLSLALLFGCNTGQPGPKLVPAGGTVTLDGKPLGAADVMFVPQDETKGQGGAARTDATGKFELLSQDRKKKGAAVGSYRVIISKLVKPDGTDFIPDPNSGPMDTGGFKELLPATYSDPNQTSLTAEVPDGGAAGLEFKLKSKGR
jgi:hypothetical protein